MEIKRYSKPQLILIIIILFFMVVQELAGMLHNSVVWDELCFVGAGKAIFSTGYMNYMLLADHPPLSYYLNSIPLIPLKFDEKIWQNNSCWKIGHEVLFKSSYSTGRLLFISRMPFIFLSILLAFFVLKWSTEIYGAKSGVFALFLYSFNPSIIAYSGIATADFTVAAMIFITAYYFWKLIKNHSKKNLLLAGIFFGLAQLSKITAIILIPMFMAMGFVALYSRQNKLKLKDLIKDFFAIMLIGFFLVLAFHKFQFGTIAGSLPPEYYTERAREEIGKIPTVSKYLVFVYDKIPLPAPVYIGMVGNIFYLSLQEKAGFVFGRITSEIVWYFPLLTFFLKTSLSLLIMLVITLILHKKLPKKDFLTNMSLLAPIILIFIIFSKTNKFAGVNHILAVYPFIFILASNLINIKIKNKKVLVTALLLSYAMPVLLIAPYYLSYVNLLAGGPGNAYKIIVGANIDQGQELLELKKFISERGISNIKLSYWGSVDPKDYNISYEYMPSPYFQPWQNNYTHIAPSPRNISEDCSKRSGLIAISVTNLQNAHLINKTCYDWLKNQKPIEKAGYSMFIYDIK